VSKRAVSGFGVRVTNASRVSIQLLILPKLLAWGTAEDIERRIVLTVFHLLWQKAGCAINRSNGFQTILCADPQAEACGE
jgi:hypothetical protein